MTNPVCLVITLYVVALWGRIILSWFPVSPGSPIVPVFSFLYAITEPVLGPVRKLMPMGMGGLDLSPIIVSFAIQLLVRPLVGC